jgi:flavorubredoxin
MHEAAKYYANIVLPYGKQVVKALEVIDNLEIDVICPSHGLVIRQFIPEIIEKYKAWSTNKTEKKALIIYDTMWGSTEMIAHSVQEAFEAKGYQTRMFNVQLTHISDIMTEILTARYICVGSPTLNNNILPTVAAFLTYLKGLAPKDRIGMAFGSYGWGGQSVGIIENTLKECGFEMLDQIKLQYVPDKDLLEQKEKKLIEQII